MSRLALVLVIMALAYRASAEDLEEKYSNKYDHMDVDGILANERLRTQYYKCLLETAPCLTPDAVFLKTNFPEAVVTKCRKCTDKQREGFDKIAVWYTENDIDSWNNLVRKAVSDFQAKGALRRAQAGKA